MSTWLPRPALAVALSSALAPTLAPQTPPDDVPTIVRTFAPFDLDGDGVVEVRRLRQMDLRGAAESPLIAVFVELRLLAGPTEAADEALAGGQGGGIGGALTTSLATYADDLVAAGFRALTLTVEVHQGPPHQDGRTLLALRRLLQRLAANGPLAGCVLVGHFPDALLVRTCNWRRDEALQLPGPDGQPVAIPAGTPHVRSVPEYVAHRCDVVLADLDGRWEEVYVAGPTALPSVTVAFGGEVPDDGGTATAMRRDSLVVTDVFHVRDGAALADPAAFAVRLDPNDRDHECSDADRACGNPLALPEIAVSRIDARGVALLPERRALEAAERPIVVAANGPDDRIAWHHDLAFERRLLCGYFARNHAFRSQPMPDERRRPAAFGHQLGHGLHAMRPADPAWADFEAAGYDVHERADLVALLHWLQRPAVLRTLRVHSDEHGGMCAHTDPAALRDALGVPWHWRRRGEQLEPSWHDHRGGRADFAYYRTLWQRQVVADAPFLLIHTGCEALSPPGAVRRSHDDPLYGERGHAESLLFFTPCLAMVGRAKVFYDEPRGFAAALGEGRTFGAAWQRYFAIERAATNWREVGGDIGRKRACFWSVVGDWTLRLPPRG